MIGTIIRAPVDSSFILLLQNDCRGKDSLLTLFRMNFIKAC